MSKVVLQEINKDDWKSDLHQYHYSLFISPEWIEAVSDTTNNPVYFNFLLNNKTIAKISGTKNNTHHGKRKQLYFYSTPAMQEFTQEIFNACFDAIYRYAKKNNFIRVVVSSFDNKHSMKYRGKKFFLTERVEYIVPLHKGTNNLKLSQRFKRNVKKGTKVNPEIKTSRNIEDVNKLLNLLASTKKIRVEKYKKNYNPYYMPGMNEDSLKRLLNSGLACLRYTNTNNSVNCIEYNLEMENSVYMLLKGTNESGYKNGLPSYLSYYLINEYANKNISYYNQGGRPITEDGNGLTIFKKSMGAEEITVYGATTNYITYPYKLLNPALRIGRKLPKDNIIVKFLKKFV